MGERHGILAIGNLLADRTLRVSDYPAESMLATISDIQVHCGGGCTNVLFNLAKLDPNLPLYLAGAVGKDAEAKLIIEQSVLHHIDIEHVISFDQKTSFTDVIINEKNGERTFFHYIGAMAQYDSEAILRINHHAKIAHFAYLPLLPKLLENSILELIDLFLNLSQKGLLISIDLVSVNEPKMFIDYIIPLLPYIDFVIINEIEADILLANQATDKNNKALLSMAEKIFAMGVKQSVIIHSPTLAVAVNRYSSVAVPSFLVEKSRIVSTLGAGDAFCSGALYGLHQNVPLEQVLQLGHAMARFNLFSVSATDGAVSYAEITDFLRQQAAV